MAALAALAALALLCAFLLFWCSRSSVQYHF